MQRYEYKAVPAPLRAEKVKGLKSGADRFALGLGEALNAAAAEGWEYLRAESLPCEERRWFGRASVSQQHMLIFRRALAATPAAPAVQAPEPLLRSAPPSMEAAQRETPPQSAAPAPAQYAAEPQPRPAPAPNPVTPPEDIAAARRAAEPVPPEPSLAPAMPETASSARKGPQPQPPLRSTPQPQPVSVSVEPSPPPAVTDAPPESVMEQSPEPLAAVVPSPATTAEGEQDHSTSPVLRADRDWVPGPGRRLFAGKGLSAEAKEPAPRLGVAAARE